MNLCTVTISVAPEVEKRRKPVSLDYLCCHGGSTVKECRYSKPLVIDGETCPYECGWFNCGCTCPTARST